MSSPPFDVLKQPQIIRAGAGAGKTTALIATFVEFCTKFYSKTGKFPRVVITTFTRKATQEIKERLLLKALQVKDDHLFHHINKKHSVHISTIHGLLTIFLNQNAEFLGLPVDIRITDSGQEKKRIRKIIKDLLKSDVDYYELFEHYRFDQLVDLISKLINFLREFPEAEFISEEILLNITLAKKNILQNKLKSFFQEIGDSEAEWRKLLTEKGFEVWKNYLSDLKSVYSFLQNDNISSALQFFEELPDKPRMGSKNSGFPESAHLILKDFLDNFNLDYSDEKYYRELHEKTNRLFFKLGQETLNLLLEEKRRTGQLTINDLELFSLELILYHPQSVQRFQADWDYFMIDEYQDTSPLQVRILDQLINNKPYFIVGDPQQSIYLFRGARSEVFFEKESKALRTPAELMLRQLQTNYRSEPGLMHFMNDYFSKLGSQFQSMTVRPDEQVKKSKIEFIDTEDQSFAALNTILELTSSGIDLKDICVLSRKNEHLVQLARLAQTFHIPVQLQVATGFSSRREIIDLGAFLRFLVNPFDNENLVLLLRSPWFYLPDDDIYLLRKKSGSLWTHLESHEKNLTIYFQLQKFLADYQTLGVSFALLKLVNEIGFLEVSQLYDSSGKREANFWKFYQQLRMAEDSPGFLLGQFLSSQFQELTEDLGSVGGEADPVIQPNRVNLMSIHASKGLQFPYVIVIGFSDKANLTNFEQLTTSPEQRSFSLAPFVSTISKNVSSSWSVQMRKEFNQKELSEHERFLYVALTRAQTRLILISEKSKKFSSSWRQLGFWPEEGLHESDHYEILSRVHESDLEKKGKRRHQKIAIRAKFQEHSDQIVDQFSVTSALDVNVNSSIEESIDKLDSTENLNFESLIKAQTGTDLHRLFESLKYNSLESLKNKVNAEQNKLLDRLVNETRIPFRSILDHGHTEMGFGLKTKNGILQGQIDLWANVEKKIYIIDYKTGRSEFQKKAFDQLSIYTICLEKMKLIPSELPIHLVAWYVTENELIEQAYKNYQDFKRHLPDKILTLFSELN